MKSIDLSLAVVASAAALMAFGCSSSSGGSPGTSDASAADAAAGDSAVAVVGSDALTDDTDAAPDAQVDAATTPTFLRFANLSPDAPALDLCVSPAGNGQWTGPVLGGKGVAYAQATAYLPLAAAGSYGVRIVAAGSKTCDVSIDGREENLSTLASGEHTTIAVEGDLQVVGSDEPFALSSYTDDDASSGTGVELRFINASANAAAVDFGEGSLAASSFAPLFTDTPLAAAGSADTVDAGPLDDNDYRAIPDPKAEMMSAHVTGGASDLATASAVTSPAGAVLTMFLIGGKTNDAMHPSQLLLCDEEAAPVGGLESCKIASL